MVGRGNAQPWTSTPARWKTASIARRFSSLIKVLLERGANRNVRMKEVPPIRRHFLKGTGSLSWVDFTGQTPFLTAALSGDVTVMRLLLEHGADPKIPTFQGTTALMAAAGVNWVFYQTYDEGPKALLEAVQLCYELGMDVNAVNSMGLTALHGAANRGSDDIIRFLVEKGAKLDVKDKEGRTPLTWAEGVFLATHPAKPKPSSIELLREPGREMMRRLVFAGDRLARCRVVTVWLTPDTASVADARRTVSGVAGLSRTRIAQTATLRRFSSSTCVTCHNQRLKTAGLALDTLDVTPTSAHDAETWEKVVRKIKTGMMPPSGAPPPRSRGPRRVCLGARSASRSCRGAGRQSRHPRAAPAEPHRIRQCDPRPARARRQRRDAPCRRTARAKDSTTSRRR